MSALQLSETCVHLCEVSTYSQGFHFGDWYVHPGRTVHLQMTSTYGTCLLNYQRPVFTYGSWCPLTGDFRLMGFVRLWEVSQLWSEIWGYFGRLCFCLALCTELSICLFHSWLQHMKELNSVLAKTFWWKLLLSQQVILFLFWCQMFYLKLYLMTIIIFIIIYLMIIMSGVSHREPKH